MDVRGIRILSVLMAICIIAGCKIALLIVEGGEVGSEFSGTCAEGTICMVEVNNTDFEDAFLAISKTGWYFEKWKSGDGFFCADSTRPVCELSLRGKAGNPVIEEVVASSETFYLMPIFRPYKDIISVDGKEWLQVDMFSGVSWQDVEAICPSGECIENGILNGQDMTGWTWATIEDINSLFNHYIGGATFTPEQYYFDGSGSQTAPNPNWGNDFFSDGWRPTGNWGPFIGAGQGAYIRSISGWASDTYTSNCVPECGWTRILHNDSRNFYDASGDYVTARGEAYPDDNNGAWFYRSIDESN